MTILLQDKGKEDPPLRRYNWEDKATPWVSEKKVGVDDQGNTADLASPEGKLCSGFYMSEVPLWHRDRAVLNTFE